MDKLAAVGAEETRVTIEAKRPKKLVEKCLFGLENLAGWDYCLS
nr:hypothetical protein HMPREF0276_1980 [Corynebacterium accolens ATCC 49725]